jgi:hypothetical protein
MWKLSNNGGGKERKNSALVSIPSFTGAKIGGGCAWRGFLVLAKAAIFVKNRSHD